MYKDFACRLSICIFPMHLLLVSYLSIYKGAKNFSTRLPYQNGVWYKCVICPLLSEHIVALNKYREKHPIAKVSIYFISKPVNILKSTLCNPPPPPHTLSEHPKLCVFTSTESKFSRKRTDWCAMLFPRVYFRLI